MKCIVLYFVFSFFELTKWHFGTEKLFNSIVKLPYDFVFELKFFSGCVIYLESSSN
jgi:hypothetical protein